jgi:hypothetical protein
MKTKKKFLIEFTEEIYKSVIIEAENEEKAQKMFYNWDFDDFKIKEGDSKVNTEDIIISEVEK